MKKMIFCLGIMLISYNVNAQSDVNQKKQVANQPPAAASATVAPVTTSVHGNVTMTINSPVEATAPSVVSSPGTEKAIPVLGEQQVNNTNKTPEKK